MGSTHTRYNAEKSGCQSSGHFFLHMGCNPPPGINGPVVHIGLWPRLLPATFITHCPHPERRGGGGGGRCRHCTRKERFKPGASSQCNNELCAGGGGDGAEYQFAGLP